MFLHLSVILFMGRKVYTPLVTDTPWKKPPGRHPPGQIPPPGRQPPLPPGRHPLADTPPSRHTLGNHPRQISPPPEMATAADGTHPTGMQSCLKFSQNFSVQSMAKSVSHRPNIIELFMDQSGVSALPAGSCPDESVSILNTTVKANLQVAHRSHVMSCDTRR